MVEAVAVAEATDANETDERPVEVAVPASGGVYTPIDAVDMLQQRWQSEPEPVPD